MTASTPIADFTITAPAKINLYLHVTGRREDGYHYLDSLVGFTDIGDRITVGKAPSFSFAVTGPMAQSLAGTDPEANLVVRAARALAVAAQRDLHCVLTLEKNLPLASGIGGGSSDAAATLLALALVWDLPGDALPLAAIARSLGQDVAACLHRRPCYFRNIGDRIEPAPDLPPMAILLANPGVQVPTPDVFARRIGKFSLPAGLPPAPCDLAALVQQLKQRRNDLYEPAIQLAPEIGDCLSAVAATPYCLLARMSGSGATCFGLYAESAQAVAAAAQLKARYPHWWVQAGHMPFADRRPAMLRRN